MSEPQILPNPVAAMVPKIVIAGTGRAGTTLLVQVLTDLGFDTGFRPGVGVNPQARAGLEKNILAANAPRIVKSPRLSTELHNLLSTGQVAVEHVIIPVRDLDIASASRIRAASYGRSLNAPGGMLWGAKRAGRQRGAVAEVLAQLMVTVAEFNLAHTLLFFPRFATDATYLHDQIGHLDPALSVDDFARVLTDRYRPEFVHQASLGRSEQYRVRLNEPIAFAKRASASLSQRVKALIAK